MQLTHISYSQITEYLACPYRWWLARNKVANQPQSVPMLKGIFIHEALKRYTESYIITATHDARVMQDIWHDVNSDLTVAINSLPLGDYNEGLKMLVDLVKSGKLDLDDTITCEEPFEFNLCDARIKGRVDRIDFIDGMYRVVDYKSGYSYPTFEGVNDDLELAIYAVALSDCIYPATAFDEPIGIAIFNVRHGKFIESIHTPDDIATTRDFLVDIWSKMSSIDKYEPNPCDACTAYNGCWAMPYCNVNKIPQEIWDVSNLTTDEIKQRITTLELWLKKLKPLVKEVKPKNKYTMSSKTLKSLNQLLVEFGRQPYELKDFASDRQTIAIFNEIKTYIQAFGIDTAEKEFVLNSLDYMFESIG